ncbi:hypothetical protein [Streptomyces sp. BRA346]|uniref:hypothetical protein n=1 Tax=Streptomyces sp. BRA346 TaxID=2878199 RepID=UPI0040632968
MRKTEGLTAVQTVGASVGAAVLAVILQHRLDSRPTAPAAAFGDTFWWVAAFAAPALLPALLLPGLPRPSCGDESVR